MHIVTHRLFLLLACLLASLPSASQSVLATVPAGVGPGAMLVNPVTHKIYVANQGGENNDGNTVTVIDGLTLSASTITVGRGPATLAVNSVTNKIFVANRADNTVTVIDGATLRTSTVPVGANPRDMLVDERTNRIYVANFSGSSETIIDGATLAASTVGTWGALGNPVVNPLTGKIYADTWSYNYQDRSVTEIDGTTLATSWLPGGPARWTIGLNPSTNQIDVLNPVQDGYYYYCFNSSSVWIVDATTHSHAVAYTGSCPNFLVVNPLTNNIYVTNLGTVVDVGETVTVINGSTLSDSDIVTGFFPNFAAINQVTNKIYVSNECGDDSFCTSPGTVTIIDGSTQAATTIPVGYDSFLTAVDPVINRAYVLNYCGDDPNCAFNSNSTVSVIGTETPALQFVPIAPCRAFDTRDLGHPIQAGTSRDFILPQSNGCHIPANAAAYSLNVTAIPQGQLAYLSVWPTGLDRVGVSTMNSDGRVKANAVISAAGYQGAVSVYASDPTHVALDVNGYFIPANDSTLAYYPLTPCRVADTRDPDGVLGGPYLQAGQRRLLPVQESHCGIPSSAQAYSFNVTAIPRSGPVWVVQAWPDGQPQPKTSTLNAPTGTVVANAAILAVGANGAIDVLASGDTDLALDVNGYFAPPGPGGLSFYPMAPCRVLDTRKIDRGAPFDGTLSPPVDLVKSACGPPSTAQAFVLNATAIPAPGPVLLLDLWADGEQRPATSTLNAWDGDVTSNMAIVSTTNGSIDAYSAGLTQLILDISGYFAP